MKQPTAPRYRHGNPRLVAIVAALVGAVLVAYVVLSEIRQNHTKNRETVKTVIAAVHDRFSCVDTQGATAKVYRSDIWLVHLRDGAEFFVPYGGNTNAINEANAQADTDTATCH